MSCNPPISLRNALLQADAIAPGRHTDPESDGICADPRHIAQGTSDHIPDSRGVPHAVDVDDDPFAGFFAHQWADVLRLRCASGELDDLIDYIISNHHITSAIHGWEWVAYHGSDPHESHIHVSIKRTSFAENWNGQWWINNPTEEQDMTKDEHDWLVEITQEVNGVPGLHPSLRDEIEEIKRQNKQQNEANRDRLNAIMDHLHIPRING